jgi:hypothetical protein
MGGPDPENLIGGFNRVFDVFLNIGGRTEHIAAIRDADEQIFFLKQRKRPAYRHPRDPEFGTKHALVDEVTIGFDFPGEDEFAQFIRALIRERGLKTIGKTSIHTSNISRKRMEVKSILIKRYNAMKLNKIRLMYYCQYCLMCAYITGPNHRHPAASSGLLCLPILHCIQ